MDRNDRDREPGRCAPQAGLTLVEVLVASLIMIVGLVSVMAVFPQSLGTARKSSRILVLNRLATEKLESLRALDYDHADLSPGPHPTVQFDSNGDRYYPGAGFPEEYSLRWAVLAGPTDGSGTAEPNMKRVVVVATYWVRYTAGGAPIENAGRLTTSFQTFLADPE
jgi:type II secretory pathway pseudopilin PulG